VTIGVFLLDDHELARVGLRSIIACTDDLMVIGEAATAAEAIEQIRTSHRKPDVAVIDLQLGHESGIAVCEWIRRNAPEVRCLVLSAFRHEGGVAGAVRAGAAGYMLKERQRTDLLRAVRTIAAGGTAFDPSLEKRAEVGSPVGRPASERLRTLSQQEMRILALIAEGRTNRQIGEAMYLAEGTVKNYVSRVLWKLGMVRRSEAAVFGARLIEAGELDSLM
jgi:two-component system response regulator DevR